MSGMTATGPEVAVPEAPFEFMNLHRLKPQFVVYDPTSQALIVQKKLIDPIMASPSDPRVIDLLIETPGYEPDLGFRYFVKGAAVLALIVEDRFHEAIKAVLQDVGSRVIDGKGLPELATDLQRDVVDVLAVLFKNNEPRSWRELIGFITGVFWLLGFVQQPDKKRGNLSPRNWARSLCMYYCQLLYVPQ